MGVFETMAKKVLPEPTPNETNNSRATLIKVLIIAVTFTAIAALSIITRGPNGGAPGAGVVTARILLLSACTVIYFLMLYHTRASRQNEGRKTQNAKK
jgi:hypothetical protein